MGRKRRLLAAKSKFGNKFSSHPRYKVANPVSAHRVSDDLSITTAEPTPVVKTPKTRTRTTKTKRTRKTTKK